MSFGIEAAQIEAAGVAGKIHSKWATDLPLPFPAVVVYTA
jgi:hypothetical protein